MIKVFNANFIFLQKYRGTKNKEVLLKQMQEELRENTNNNAREETSSTHMPEKNDQPLGKNILHKTVLEITF